MKKISTYKKKADKSFKSFIKARDKYTCQRCLKVGTGQNIHASHIIPTSKGNALRWDLNNAIALCFHCHINWWHKNPLEASEWFKEHFPQKWQYLQAHKEDIKKFTIDDLKELTKKYEGLLDGLDTNITRDKP